MANFLKLNKSYLGPELMSNGSLEEYGPDLVINGDFASNTWWDVETPEAEISNGKVNFNTALENYGFGRSNLLATGKQYKIVFTIDTYTSGAVHLNIGSLAVNSYSSIGTYTAIVVGDGSNFFGIQSENGGAILSIDNVSVTESGAVELVDNGQFIGVANGTDVTTLSQWTFSSLTSSNIESNILECIASGPNEFVFLSVPTVVGTEYRFKVDSVTGDLADDSIRVSGEAVDVTSGSGELVFTATGVTTTIQFYAGDTLSAAQTNYTGISLQATNQFAYGFSRPTSGDNAGGQYSVFDLPSKTVRFIAPAIGGYIIQDIVAPTVAGQEYLIKINVAAIVGSVPFIYFNGSSFVQINLEVGDNEFRYKRLGTNNSINFGIEASNASEVGSSITLNSISLQDVVNQPKLIGVDNVSMVSAPTDDTVVINNGLTDGADTLTITYAGASASSRVQMRNFFQDSIVRLANSNNTAEVLEITPPVLITDIVAS